MLRTFDPFRELERLAETTFSPGLAYDIVRHEDRFELFIDLPGVDPATIDLTVDGRDLTLTAQREFVIADSATVVRSGRTHGTYNRTFHLGDRLDTEGLTADYASGVLSIVLPIAASAKPRKVSVNSDTVRSSVADPSVAEVSENSEIDAEALS